MGVVLIDGFEFYLDARSTPHGAQSEWQKGYLDQNLVIGRFGGQCLEHTRAGGTEDIERNLPDGNITTGQVTIGFAWKTSNAVTRPLLRLRQHNNTNTQISIWQHSDGAISIRRGNDDATLVTTAAALIVLDQWHYLELSVAVSDAGSLSFSLDGVERGAATGVDTQAQSNNHVGRICLPEPDSSGTMWYDDFYVRDDLTKHGPSRVMYRRANTPVPGGAFNLTATAPVNAFDYAVSGLRAHQDRRATASAIGDAQQFNYEKLVNHSGSALHAVQMLYFIWTDTGTGKFKPVVTSGVTSVDGPEISFDNYPRFLRHLVPNDPATSAPWTRGGFDAAEIGLRVTDMAGGAASVRLGLMGAEVLVPADTVPAMASGHRFWAIAPQAINGGNRPGSWAYLFVTDDGEMFRPFNFNGSLGGQWTGLPPVNAVDGRADTAHVSGMGATETRFSCDFGGPVVPDKFVLGAQPFFLSESVRLFKILYSDDGVTWTEHYNMTASQTGWAEQEKRVFNLPPLTPPVTTSRRRQALIIN